MIVMHPGHAEQILKTREIPKENIAYWEEPGDKNPTEDSRARSMSVKEAKRVEAERLKRYRAKAMKRLARLPKPREAVETARLERKKQKAQARRPK